MADRTSHYFLVDGACFLSVIFIQNQVGRGFQVFSQSFAGGVGVGRCKVRNKRVAIEVDLKIKSDILEEKILFFKL